MNSRERVLRTFQFLDTDRPACDFMEGSIWPELMEYFKMKYGFQNTDEVKTYLDLDFRWAPDTIGGNEFRESLKDFRVGSAAGPFQGASVEDIIKWDISEPDWGKRGQINIYKEMRLKYPDKALVFSPGWLPLFWNSCEAFGSEIALITMMTEPQVYDAFIRRMHNYTMEIIRKELIEAQGNCDICLLGDDFASQQSMLISPDCWRKFIKPYLSEQVRAIREKGMYVMYHSCGSVREILYDLIDIGINALLVFQTTARGMDAESVAKEYGGKLVFYGGIDVQHLLSFGTEDEIRETVIKNIRAFENCGGYIVANSHHNLSTIRGENLEIMIRAVKEYSNQSKCLI